MPRPRKPAPMPSAETKMGRPTSRPRLNALDIEGLAMSSAAEVFRHFNAIARHLRPAVEPLPKPSTETLSETRVAKSVRSLGRFAQEGEGRPDVAEQQASDLREGLGRSPKLSEDAEDPLGLLLGVVAARIQLASGQTIDLPWLGALANVSRESVRLQLLEGSMKLDDADDQVKWLSAQHVAGFMDALGPGKCQAEQCGRPSVHLHGSTELLCLKHRREQLLLLHPPAGPMCTVPACGKPEAARGLCSKHYHQARAGKVPGSNAPPT